jgi:hypothetical protein
MPQQQPMNDVIVLIPGILGSVLVKDRHEVWGASAQSVVGNLRTFGRPSSRTLATPHAKPRGEANPHLPLDGRTRGALMLGGRDVTRTLITIGTPYQGSINALDTLVNGLFLGRGPLGISVDRLVRSFPYGCGPNGRTSTANRIAIAAVCHPEAARPFNGVCSAAASSR